MKQVGSILIVLSLVGCGYPRPILDPYSSADSLRTIEDDINYCEFYVDNQGHSKRNMAAIGAGVGTAVGLAAGSKTDHHHPTEGAGLVMLAGLVIGYGKTFQNNQALYVDCLEQKNHKIVDWKGAWG